MDDMTDFAWYRMERQARGFGDRKRGTEWDEIEDNHYPECPTAIKARQRLACSLCLCDRLEAAAKSYNEDQYER